MSRTYAGNQEGRGASNQDNATENSKQQNKNEENKGTKPKQFTNNKLFQKQTRMSLVETGPITKKH